MKTLLRLGAVAGATLAATAVLSAPASAASHDRHDGVVFVQTDDVDGNKVVAYDRSQDGTLTLAASYRTGSLAARWTGPLSTAPRPRARWASTRGTGCCMP